MLDPRTLPPRHGPERDHHLTSTNSGTSSRPAHGIDGQGCCKRPGGEALGGQVSVAYCDSDQPSFRRITAGSNRVRCPCGGWAGSGLTVGLPLNAKQPPARSAVDRVGAVVCPVRRITGRSTCGYRKCRGGPGRPWRSLRPTAHRSKKNSRWSERVALVTSAGTVTIPRWRSPTAARWRRWGGRRRALHRGGWVAQRRCPRRGASGRLGLGTVRTRQPVAVQRRAFTAVGCAHGGELVEVVGQRGHPRRGRGLGERFAAGPSARNAIWARAWDGQPGPRAAVMIIVERRFPGATRE